MAELYYAGLDIGGTSGRLRLVAANGQNIGEYEAEGCSINTDGAEKSRLKYRELVLPVLNNLGFRASDCQGICVAASGIDSQVLEQSCRSAFEEMGFASQKLTVVNDCQVFLHLTAGPSMVIISGTGSICYGRDDSGRVFRTGGWNHIISDEGSAFDMGLKTLRAAGESLDGRKECSLLTDLVIRETGLNSLEKLNDFINDNLFEKSRIARLSRTASEAAGLGDAAAIAVHEECAKALIGLIMDTYGKLCEGEPDLHGKGIPGSDSAQEIGGLQLWLWGSVLVKNELIRELVTEEIKRKIPGIRIGIVPETALDTAIRIAMK